MVESKVYDHPTHPTTLHFVIPKENDGKLSLVFGLHGGGGCPPQVNDSQWENHKDLYGFEKDRKDILWVCPRAPTNNWNLWHEPHIDEILLGITQNFNILGLIDPNRVYITGYSAGGDGVYKLAPRIACYLAGAVMSAGHPNGSGVENLINTSFAIQIGANDGAYNRNSVALEYSEKLKLLREEESCEERYIYRFDSYNTGHWMNKKDKSAIEWALDFTRNPQPRKIVWK